MLLSFGLLIISVAILYFGAEFSLNSSEKIGIRLGLPPLIVGMVLVGFGTSLPEFFVAHIAGSQGRSGIAIGGLVGSNIANMLLVLGTAGLITQFSVFSKGMQKHLGIHLLLGVLLVFVLNQVKLTMIVATPLLLLCCFYMFLLVKDIKDESTEKSSEDKSKPLFLGLQLLVGFIMLYLGGELLVKSGSDLCLALGMSEYLVSSIFIAFGTSFPELVTALLAAIKKKHTDLIIGNIVGSNLFNCAFILGSLGIYNFDLNIDFTWELSFLIGGSLMLFLMNYFKKYFHVKTGLFFVLGYISMVLKWTDVI